ncbi:MAG: DUF2007 domain-containing protein [Bacteroidales bacterium]|nr:DUF2007 domain-containing protein [Bacteroidales bacterium]MDD4670071.1 DUF2007 domain-containing protein [Bacteroidales bacterium]
MKEVASFIDPFEAHVAQGVLENEGITAAVWNESSSFPGFGYMPQMAVKLVVNDEDYEMALKVLEAASNTE